jgi:hypothetical protein
MRVTYFFPFLIYACVFRYNWLAVVSSLSISRITRTSSSLLSKNDIDPYSSLDIRSRNETSGMIYANNLTETESKLSCRVLGFYPFPTSPPGGPLGWLLKDTHQAIIVTETTPRAPKTLESRKVKLKKTSLLMDFMTKNGASHPVWYDEIVKWNVFLGGNIDGEVRVKVLGAKTLLQTTNTRNEKFKDAKVLSMNSSESNVTYPKMTRLIAYANDYDCRMNLYSNNCRMFAARMEREVERLNSEDTDSEKSSHEMAVADMRCALRIMWAAVLPALYPLGIILLVYEGCFIS